MLIQPTPIFTSSKATVWNLEGLENVWYEDVGKHIARGGSTEFQKTKAEGGAITCEGHRVAEMRLESEFSGSQASASLSHRPATPLH